MIRAPTPVLARTPVLSRTAHDRAALRRDDQPWLSEAWPTARVLLLAADGTTPVRREEESGRVTLAFRRCR